MASHFVEGWARFSWVLAVLYCVDLRTRQLAPSTFNPVPCSIDIGNMLLLAYTYA